MLLASRTPGGMKRQAPSWCNMNNQGFHQSKALVDSWISAELYGLRHTTCFAKFSQRPILLPFTKGVVNFNSTYE